jgi:hypothetical protein
LVYIPEKKIGMIAPNPDEPELKIEYLWISLAQRKRWRRVAAGTLIV